ncbi:MAG: hypothetical protein NWF04_05585 [Candidatus Bathyarchaeota archaeon]|nr:hypothetical protein [Candidatus Bathyarchaeota archaeon]
MSAPMERQDIVEERLLVLKCECGTKILLIPDVEVMSRAIATHVEEHRSRERDPIKAEANAQRIENTLIRQLITKVVQAHP